MRSIMQQLIILSIVISIPHINSEIGVPVLLWSANSDKALQLSPSSSHSTVSQITANTFRDDYINGFIDGEHSDDNTVVAFVLNSLSVEQFGRVGNRRGEVLAKIFGDQKVLPLFLSDVLNPTEAFVHFSPQRPNTANVHNGNTVVIELPGDDLRENGELITELMHKIGENVSSRTLYLLTARENEYNSNDNEVQRIGRHVLQTQEPVTNNTGLVNVDNCLYFYSRGISYKANGTTFSANETKPDPEGSRCWNISASNSSQTQSAILKLHYKNDSVDITLEFSIDSGYARNNVTNGTDFVWGPYNNGWWRISNGTAKINDSQSFDLSVSDIYAESDFSYSCPQLELKSVNMSNGITIIISSFQLQPFHSNGTTVFADSFDCSTWMTVPIWMGFITLSLLFIILAIGIYFIMQINTNDRFENPKGKPLVITKFDE